MAQRARGQDRRWVALSAIALLIVLCGAVLARAVFGLGAPAAPLAWTPVAGPQTLVHALVRAPWGTLYAGTALGVYDSADGGLTWRSPGQGFPGPGVEAWSVAALGNGKGGAVLAAASDGYVYRLAPGQTRWARSGPQLGADAVFALLALPQPGAVLAGSDRGIYRSADGGRSWTPVASVAGGDVASFARDAASGAVYAAIAGPARSLLVSLDEGRTWRPPAGRLPPPSVEAVLAASGRIYAGVMGVPGAHAVWVGGLRGFSPFAAGLPRDSHGMALAAAGGGDGRLLVGTMGVGVYGKAPGRPWTRLGRGPDAGVITALLVLPDRPPVALAGTGSGIYRLPLDNVQ